MRIVRWLTIAMIISLATAAAQTESAQPQSSPKAPDQQPPSQDKKADKKKKNDKKSDDSSGQDAFDTSVFSERIANDVLGQIRDGLEGHTQRLMLGAFDSFKMDGYLQFEDQIERYFKQYDGFRVHFTIAQTSVEGPRGIILVNARIEQMPSGGGPRTTKQAQLRFELERGKKGWKIVDMRDRGFFS